MHDYLMIIRKRDDYFLFIYWNCMIYRLNRNSALHEFLEDGLAHTHLLLLWFQSRV